MLTTPPRSRSRTPSRIAFIAASVRGPWSHYHLEIATAPAGFTRPGAQPSARRPAQSRRDASSPPVFMSAGRKAHARDRSRVRAHGAGVTDGCSTLEDGREEECARTKDSNPGYDYLVRGYSPSMHFFWRGDMPHYSPPLPSQRGRAGCPFMLARGQTARAQRGVTVVCAGRRAPGRAQGQDRGRARWLAGRRPCPAWGSRTCTLAGGPSPVPGAGVASGRGLLRPKHQVCNHQANDKILPGIYAFLGWRATRQK